VRCFGLRVADAVQGGNLACSSRVLRARDVFGGIVLAASELPKPILLGEVAQDVAAVEAVWDRGGGKMARLIDRAGRLNDRIRPFAIVLPRHIKRLRLVARDADSHVVGVLKVCCPTTGVRFAPLLPLCHGDAIERVQTQLRRRSRGGLQELMACPPVDLVMNVDLVASSYD
jgi:hypothetical protein